jgi:hypothetical protein
MDAVSSPKGNQSETVQASYTVAGAERNFGGVGKQPAASAGVIKSRISCPQSLTIQPTVQKRVPLRKPRYICAFAKISCQTAAAHTIDQQLASTAPSHDVSISRAFQNADGPRHLHAR